MTVTLCTREDFEPENVLALNPNDQTEETAQFVVLSVLEFFKSFLDTRPYVEVFDVMSARAHNILVRQGATTVGDVKRMLIRATSNQGVPNAGATVRKEWADLIRRAAHV